MLPKALNWTTLLDNQLSPNLYPLWVFFDIAGEDDYIFYPHTDDEMREMIDTSITDEDIEPFRKIIELSMLARSDPLFEANFLDDDEEYTPQMILSMDFPIDRDEMTSEQYFATQMSMDVRKARGWNGAVVFALKVPIEQFIFLTGTLPHAFKNGSIKNWDTKKLGFPMNWNEHTELLSFGILIFQSIKALNQEQSEGA